MINSNELRRGNYVNHDVMGFCRVTTIYKNSFDCTTDDKDWFTGAISEPIHLTPEIMEKCEGLKHGYLSGSGQHEYWYKDKVRILLPMGIVQLCFMKLPVNITELHKLQNAWPFLTGEELQVNL